MLTYYGLLGFYYLVVSIMKKIWFDCETTGLNVKKDEILSIGGVKIINNKIEFSESFRIFRTAYEP